MGELCWENFGFLNLQMGQRQNHFLSDGVCWKFLTMYSFKTKKAYLLGLPIPKGIKSYLAIDKFQLVELWVKNFAQTGASVGFVQRVSQDLCTGPTLGRGGPESQTQTDPAAQPELIARDP